MSVSSSAEPNGNDREGDRDREPNRAIVESMESFRNYLIVMASQKLSPDLLAKGGASDLVQETFLEAHRDIDTFQGGSEQELKTWLCQILNHNALNFARRYKRTGRRAVGLEVSLDRPRPDQSDPDELPASTLSPSGHAMRNEQAELIKSALRRLSEKDRLLVVWRNQENLSWDTIAQRIQGNADQARKAWLRALERLRAEIESVTIR